MKEALISGYEDGSLKVNIHEVPIPTPGPTQVLIKVIVSGTNPKDWKGPLRLPSQNHTNTGDDIAGLVHAVGSNVSSFSPGDKVASLHNKSLPHGSFAKYALGEEHTTFHLPPHVTFEEAATIPLAAMTAAIGLFSSLGLPEPWKAPDEGFKGGIIVYGAGGAVGAFALKLLRKCEIHPVIAVAGGSQEFVRGMLDESRGDVIIDYRRGDEAVVEGIKAAIKPGTKLRHDFDAVSEHGSYLNIAKAMQADGFLTKVTPGHEYKGLPEQMHHVQTFVPTTFTTNQDFAAAWFRLFYFGLRDGWLSGHPYEVIPGDLEGVQEGLERLRDGKASGVKYVYRIGPSDVE